MPSLLLGVDLGTTTAKAAVFDTSGNVVAEATEEYPTHYPRRGWVEQDPEDWWRAVVKVLNRVLENPGVSPRDIEAVAVSSQRETIALLDGEGRPLGRAVVWMDTRSLDQARWFEERFGAWEVYRRTGLRISPTFTATKLLWLRENEPERLRRAKVFLQPKDYLVYRLTGEYVTDHSVASRTMFFDVEKGVWIDEFFEETGVPNLFPRVAFSDEVVGTVTEEAARATGLRKGTPVVGGGGDRTCEVLGAAVVSENEVEESTGTGSTTATTLRELRLDRLMRVVYTRHVIRGAWALEAGMATAGAVLRWFRDNFAPDVQRLAERTGRRAYEFLDMEAEKVPPGSGGLIVLPFFAGSRAPRWNPLARGLVFGLTVYHTRAHVFRALMESIAYEVRKILGVLGELGIRPREIKLLGGGGKTPTWARIKADVTGVRVVLPRVLDTALLGDAILAGVGAGVFQDPVSAARKLEKVRLVIDPDPGRKRVYDRYYALYERLASAMEGFYREAAGLPEVEPRVSWTQDRVLHILFRLED